MWPREETASLQLAPEHARQLSPARPTAAQEKQCSYVVFPTITDTAGDEVDGIEYSFRWQEDEF